MNLPHLHPKITRAAVVSGAAVLAANSTLLTTAVGHRAAAVVVLICLVIAGIGCPMQKTPSAVSSETTPTESVALERSDSHVETAVSIQVSSMSQVTEVLKTVLTSAVNAAAADVPAFIAKLKTENVSLVGYAATEIDSLLKGANLGLIGNAFKGEIESAIAAAEPSIEAAILADETAGAGKLLAFFNAEIAKIPS